MSRLTSGTALVPVACAVWLLATGGLHAQTPVATPPPAQTRPPRVDVSIEVVGATPIHGLGIDRNKIPGNIQLATAEQLKRTGALSLSGQLNASMPAVHINEATTNLFQPDVQFRGFVGSPLLGLPQGLAVYQNGVRLNEPFGDTINWDLLPANAIASVNLMPGSNPLFGLNALGGAVSVQTKTGVSHPGHDLAVSGGSFGRYAIDGESGGTLGPLSYFVAGSAMTEDGWRDFSPSRVGQLFGDIEWRRGATALNGTVNTVANRLIGNGAAPAELLEESRSAIFTSPDETKTKMTLLTLRGSHHRGQTVSIDGMLFYRRVSILTFNGDDSDYDACDAEDFGALLCSDEGEGAPVVDRSGHFILNTNAAGALNGTQNTSRRLSNGWGGSLQVTLATPLSGRPNHFVAGVSSDGGPTNYESDTEIAQLTTTRETVGTGDFDRDAAVRLRASVRHAGVFAANFFTIVPRLTVMAAARFNHSAVTLRDRIGTALDGDHAFSRLNPAVGFTYDLSANTNVFSSVSTSSRVPAPSELSCADPDDPCRLPNAFVADPPLEQVIARTWEGGIRGRRGPFTWNAAVFRTAASDDILFISSGPLTNTGHFENVGDTRRQGVEVSVSAAFPTFRWDLAYSFVSARFGSPLTLSSGNHPFAEGGEIEVASGDWVPGVPQHSVKLNVSGTFRRVALGANLLVTSNQYLRGDEANLLTPMDGYAVVNLNATYALARRVALTARVTNLVNAEYSTFGVLGEADDVLGDEYDDPRFLSPAAPRAAWVGLQFSFR